MIKKTMTVEEFKTCGYARFAKEDIEKGYALPVWMLHVEDITNEYPCLSEDQARYAIHYIVDHYDSEYGISHGAAMDVVYEIFMEEIAESEEEL